MLSRIASVGLRGVEGYPVHVELDLANGLPGYTTVGLPDSAVRESRERVSSAVRNSGYRFPPRRITVNLAPAQSRKQGTHFDLPIALAVLSASGQIPPVRDWPGRFCFVGELALDGGLRPVMGMTAMAAQARAEGFSAMVVPADNVAEARAAGMRAFAGESLRQVADFLGGTASWTESWDAAAPGQSASKDGPAFDLADVKGQGLAKRALEIAAAGAHNLLLVGPPGSGKSMLARRLPGLLPPMSEEEALEATRVHSLTRPVASGLLRERPFRSPHHAASAASLIGGGPSGRPGEISLAHAGVLFLDELPEFSRPCLEALRQPLEDGVVEVNRAREVLRYPARFLFVAAANPCPCGWLGHSVRECSCTPPAVAKYQARLSGPLLDRIDLQIEVAPVAFSDWVDSCDTGVEGSAEVRSRAVAARSVQLARQGKVNASLSPAELKVLAAPDAEGLGHLEAAAARGLSARSLDRMLRVARTIADLAGRRAVSGADVAEALHLRALGRFQGGGA